MSPCLFYCEINKKLVAFLQLPPKGPVLERSEQEVQFRQRGPVGGFQLLHHRHPAGESVLEMEGTWQ